MFYEWCEFMSSPGSHNKLLGGHIAKKNVLLVDLNQV